MLLNFKSLGLEFYAECAYAPGWPGSHMEPPEPPELEIQKLRHAQTSTDVSFLLDSNVIDQLYEDAWDAVVALNHDEEEPMCLSY